MAEEPWFPAKLELPDGSRLGRLLFCGNDWQVYRIDRHRRVLIATAALRDRWVGEGLLPTSAFGELSFGHERFVFLPSGEDQLLEPMSACSSPETKADGLAFAFSLRETRRILPEASLHDSVYVERLSRLLPTWSLSEAESDEDVMGRWLTGGVKIPVTSTRRLSNLVGWLGRQDIDELIEASGIAASAVDNRATEGSRRKNVSGESSGVSEPQEAKDGEPKRRFVLSGRPQLESFFNEHVIDIVEHPERYRPLGIDFPTAIVLHGPPGCGKTFAIEQLVEYLDWPIFSIDSNTVGSPYIHETSRKVSEVFDKAIDAAPSIIVIDEMESYLSDRQLNQSSGMHRVEEVAEFLRRIPEAAKRHVLVVGMTNRIEMIDSAILRRGRFDHILEVGMPTADEVSELIDSLVSKVPVEGTIDTCAIVEALTDRPLSDAAFVVREGARLAARSGQAALNEALLLAALESLPPRAEQKRSVGFIQD